MAETNTTYYQSRHTGEEIDDLLDQSVAATEAANASAKKADDAAENANQEAAKIPGMVTGKADLDPATGLRRVVADSTSRRASDGRKYLGWIFFVRRSGIVVRRGSDT